MIQISQRRRERQGGQQILEFGLVGVLFIPMLMGSFVTGMQLIRSLQVNQMCRDINSMYIHGSDFSTYNMQVLANRLAQGLNLQIGASFAGNSRNNTANGGSVLVTVSQIVWVGATTDPQCTSVGASNCVNANSFVFNQRIQFGNGSVSGFPNTLGTPLAASTSYSANGTLLNPLTDSGSALPSAGQTAMKNMWQTTSNGRTPLVDGQQIYVTEVWVVSPDLSLGSILGGGQYAIFYF